MNLKTVLRPLALLSTLLFFTETTTAQQRLQIAQAQNQSALQQAPKQKALQQAQNQSAQQDATQSEATSADNHQNPNASPFDAVQGKKEAVEKRDAFSKHYVNEDGSYTALIGAGPIHYEKNGAFLDIDHNITRSNDANFPYANTANLFESYFGATVENGVRSITAEGEILEFINPTMYWEVNGQKTNVVSAANTQAQIQNDIAVYPNIFGDVSAEYTVKSGHRQLNYIIPTKQSIANAPTNADYLVFTEQVKLPANFRIVDGIKQYNRLKGEHKTISGVFVKDAFDKVIFEYSAPAIYENYSSDIMGLPSQIMPEISFKDEGEWVQVIVKVKAEWLLANDRVYPIAIDPTATAYPFSENYSSGQTYSSGGGSGNIAAGYVSGWYRGWATFNLSGLPSMSNVTAASVSLYITNKFGNMGGANSSINIGHTAFDLSRLKWISNYTVLYNTITSAQNGMGAYNYMPNQNIDTWATVNLKPGTNTLALEEIERKSGSDIGFFPISFSPSWGSGTTQRAYVIAGYNDSKRPYLTVTYDEVDKYNHAAYELANAADIGDVGYIQIGNVSIGDINNNTTITNWSGNASVIYRNTPSGYNKYDLSTDVEVGETYPLQVTYRDVGGNNGKIAVWVDWNEDGDFADADEYIGVTPVLSNGNPHTFNITVPNHATPGVKRLRLRSAFHDVNLNASAYDAIIDYGETEDYNLNVVQAFTPPTDVVFYNIDGDDDEVQLAFNNSRSDSSQPIFRLSHQTETADTYEIQVSPNYLFTSPTTQQFNGTYNTNTETNFTFTNGFTLINGNTYYVRARAAKSGDWSDWSSQVHTFTYKDDQDTSDWYQTTKVQFETGTLDGVEVPDGNIHYVTPQSGGSGNNPFVNPSFEQVGSSDLPANWNRNGANWINSIRDDDYSSDGNYSLAMYIRQVDLQSFGGYDASSDNLSVYQNNVDLTDVTELKFELWQWYIYGFGADAPVSFQVIIDDNNSNGDYSTGTVVYDKASVNTQEMIYGTQTVDLTSYGFTGNKTVKLVYRTKFSSPGNYNAYIFYIDNLRVTKPSTSSGSITSTPIHLASVAGADGYAGVTWEQELNGGELNLKVQGSTNGVTFTDISGYTAISESGDGEKTFDLSGIDANNYPHIRLVGELDGADVKMYNWSVQFKTEPQYDYIYHDDTIKWTPNNPGDVSNPSGPAHTILVMEGTATFTTDVEGLTLTVLEDANLNVEKVLKLNGNLTNDGHITFVNSSIDDTAQFAEFNHDILGDGLVTTERFIPAKRSFRFLTPTVNTTTTIRENWQENGSNDPYWGTHITGNGGAANGFDPTGTNNPSMFTYSNDAAQTWSAVPNTDVLTLEAGTPYRIMVRGDRTADLTNNDAVGNDTRLRATGKLVTGDFNVLDNNNSLTDGNYIFVANPYQAKVDLYELLASSSNVGEAFYYIWEPGLSSVNGRGAYTTFDFSTGEPITTGATATHQIQPGQAIFLVASGSNPSLLFKEGQKSTSGEFSTTFRSTTARIKMSLFYQDSFDDNDTASDGIMIKFAEDGNNDVDQYDAHKLGNLDENLAVVNNDTRLSIESRDLPTHEEILPLFINNYRKTDYVLAGEFKFIPERTTAYLYDNYTDTYTEILTDGFEYRFSVDPAIEASISSKRFDVRFSVDPLLGIDDDQMTSVTVYPNPFSNDNFTIAAKGMEGQQLQVHIVNMLGQQIYNNTLTVSENGTVVVKLADAIASGVYHVNIVSENQQSVSKKLIKN